MGIENIHILVDQGPTPFQLAQEALAQKRSEEHRRGLHPWGSMRRDCPLCQDDS
jgi:hypothetical protein